MYCEYCGAELKEGQLFCPKCGAKIEIKEKKINKNKTSKGKKIIALVCCVALIVTGTLGGLYLKNRSNKDTEEANNNFVALEEGFTDVKVTDETSALNAIDSVKDVIGISDVQKELKIDSINTLDETTYYKYQQYHQSIPVYKKTLQLATSNEGNVVALVSNYVQLKDVVKNKKAISQSKIKDIIKKYLIKKLGRETSIIYLDNADDENRIIYIHNGSGLLAYVLCVVTNNGTYNIVVNSNNGKILDSEVLVQNESAEVSDKDNTAKATGWKNDDGSYHLYNDNYKISIFDVNGINTVIDAEGSVHTNFTEYSIDTMYSNNSFFDKDGIVALKKTCNVAQFYKALGHTGFERVHVAINDGYDDGNNARGGGGIFDGTLGAILLFGKNFDFNEDDVIGHEYTHAITHSIVGWDSKHIQTSALDEAYSDIMGILYENPKEPDWKLEHLSTTRNLINPTENGNYQTVESIKNKNITNQYSISTIFSHCVYLMWNGIDGNDSKRISSDKLSRLMYNSLFLITPDAEFSNGRSSVELAARIMLNNGTLTPEQYQCIKDAFDEVGIKGTDITYKYTVKNDFDLKILNSKGNDDLTVNYKIYKSHNLSNSFILGLFFYGKDLIEQGALTKGNKHLSLKSGTYTIEISGKNSKAETKSISLRIVVDGSYPDSKEEVTIRTDYDDVLTIYLNETTTEKSALNNESAYKEYAKIYADILGKYGKLQTSSKYYNQFYTGINYAELIDFNQDGIDELYIIYASDGEYSPKYTFEVWGYKDNTIQKLDSGEPYGTDGGVKHASISEHEGQKYVLTGGDDSFCFSYFHGFDGADFKIVKSIECDDFVSGEGTYKVDGKNCSEQEYNDADDEWRENTTWYTLLNNSYENDMPKVKEIIRKTEEALGINSNKSENSSQLTESELKKIAENEVGNVAQFEYHDYDHNGTKEAFFVSAIKDDEWGVGDTPWKVYFIYSDGKIEQIYVEDGWSYYFDDSKKYYEADDSQGFFCYNKGALGSGWLTDVYSVKDGQPKKLDSSGVQGLNQKDDGTFYTTKNEFKEGGGHEYPEYELIYDSSACEFTIGSRLS